jgi:hypothetical protein
MILLVKIPFIDGLPRIPHFSGYDPYFGYEGQKMSEIVSKTPTNHIYGMERLVKNADGDILRSPAPVIQTLLAHFVYSIASCRARRRKWRRNAKTAAIDPSLTADASLR